MSFSDSEWNLANIETFGRPYAFAFWSNAKMNDCVTLLGQAQAFKHLGWLNGDRDIFLHE